MNLRDKINRAFDNFERARRSAVSTGRIARHVSGVLGHADPVVTRQVRAELKRMEAVGLVRKVQAMSAVNETCWERVS